MSHVDLADWEMVDALVEQAGTHVPDYADEVLAATARVRQRPAWTFPGRWLPAAASQPFIRWAFVATLLGLAMLAGLLAWAGSRPAPMPRTWANGIVATGPGLDGQSGPIKFVTIDPSTRAVTNAAAAELRGFPVGFSPDGTRFAFLASEGAGGASADGLMHLFTSAPDGTDVVRLTGEPLEAVTSASWAPDGRRFAVSFSLGGAPRVATVASDGSAMRVLDLGGPASGASWSPGGDRILYSTWPIAPTALYTVAVDDPAGDIRLIHMDQALPPSGVDPQAAWSPDGERIAYIRRADRSIGFATGTSLAIARVGGISNLAPITSQGTLARPRWSPDGRSVLVTEDAGSSPIVLVRADGTDVRPFGPWHSVSPNLLSFAWSPDGRMIIAGPVPQQEPPFAPQSSGGTMLIDVAASEIVDLIDLPVDPLGTICWQPVAP